MSNVTSEAVKNAALMNLIADWREAKTQLDVFKKKEAELRQLIADSPDLFDQTKETGTQRYKLAQGWQIKLERKLNYSVSNDNGELFSALEEIAAMGEVAAYQAKRLFSFKPDLKLSVYKELGPEAREIVDPFITSKPGMPTVELIPPAEEKA